MATLNNYPNIAKSLKISSTSQIKILHRLLFGTDGDRQNRSRLRKFAGFQQPFELEKTKQKMLKEFSLKDLISVCNILHLEFSTDPDKCANTILTSLSDLSLLKAEFSDVSECEVNDSLPVESQMNNVAGENSTPSLPIADATEGLWSAQPRISFGESKQNVLPSAETTNFSFQLFGLKDIVDLIQPFSSRDNYLIENFISDVEEIFYLYRINNPIHQITFVKKCLTGPAQTLIRSIRGITNWEQLKHHLLDEFSDKINSIQLHQLMESRRMKPSETLQEYFFSYERFGTQRFSR